MDWLFNDRGTTAQDDTEPAAGAERDVLRPVAGPETTPRQFAFRLAVMFGMAVVVPGFHLRSLSVLSAAIGVLVGYGAACAHERLDSPRLTAWDEAAIFLSIAWLAFRLF